MSSINSKVNVTKAQNENHKRILSQLLKLEDNRRCADCQARGPTWASVNLGVFVCLNCSGVHRSLGTHMSKVRSTTLDTWLPEQVAFVEIMGNRRANLYWEAELPAGFRRPFEGDMEGLKNFIGNKYRDQAFALRTWDKPPTIENFTVHPFMQQFAGADLQRATSPPPAAAAADSAAAEAPVPPAIEGVSSTVARALAPPPKGAAKPPEQPRDPTPPPATEALFDLLSLDEAPAAAPPARPASAPPGDNGGWAAFADSAPAAAQPAAEEDPWDAFQSAVAAAPAQPSSRTDPGHVASNAPSHTNQPPADPLRSPASPLTSRASTPGPSSATLDLFQGLETHNLPGRPPQTYSSIEFDSYLTAPSQPSGRDGPAAVDLANLLAAPDASVDPFASSGSDGFANFPAIGPDLQGRTQSGPAQAGSTFVANFPEVPPAVQAVKAGQAHVHKKSADDIMRMFDRPAAGGPGGFIPAFSMAPHPSGFGGVPNGTGTQGVFGGGGSGGASFGLPHGNSASNQSQHYHGNAMQQSLF